MFYRPGGGDKPINLQYDMVYTDAIGGVTGWLPISEGNTIAVNIVRASIVFGTPAQSRVIKSALSWEGTVILEMKMFNGDKNDEAWPIDQWQNVVVATSRRAHRDGWVRLRLANVNNGDGTGVAMALQVSRTGDVGAQT